MPAYKWVVVSIITQLSLINTAGHAYVCMPNPDLDHPIQKCTAVFSSKTVFGSGGFGAEVAVEV